MKEFITLYVINCRTSEMESVTMQTLKRKLIKWRRSKKLLKVYELLFSIVGKLPKAKKVFIFESFHGKQYSDSPRAIYEYINKNYPEAKLYWSVDKRFVSLFQKHQLNILPRFTLKWLWLMPRAEYWVINSRLPNWIPKPTHTNYLQTWHGTPLKKLALDLDDIHMPGTNLEKYKLNFRQETAKWDYLISPNRYSTEIFERAFAFKGKMIESGYPRNDFLINHANNDETVNKIKEKLGIDYDKKIILYAPTWRDNQYFGRGRYKYSSELDLHLLKEELGDDYVVVLRMHYLVADNLDLTGLEDFVVDGSKHEDIRELYIIADLLITDYSSVFFDYANLKRPMIFFVYDLEEYRDTLRGFYFDFEQKAPGPLVKTSEQVLAEIKAVDGKEFIPSQIEKEFYEKFCYLEDGEASKRVAEQLLK